MSFVSVPSRSSSDVDLKKTISRFIEKTYGSSSNESVSKSLDKLQEMRKLTVMRLRDKSLAGIKQIATYHDTLLLLESRVSMSETEARVDWKWTDITGKTKKVCTSAFERANLIFCYGAMHSQVAESSDIKDEAGLKQAVISLKDWHSAFLGKVQLYSALSQYYQSKACQDSKAFGERVTRLQVAYDLLKTAIRSNSAPGRQGLLDQLKRERESADKDNNFIYHDHVPNAKDLTPVPTDGGIGKIDLVLPLLKGEVKDLFSALVPLGVLEAKIQAEVILRSLVAAENHRLREATNGLNAVMVSLNLPAAIQVNAEGDSYDQLLETVGKVRKQGGVEQLRQYVFSLPESANRNREILKQQQITLNDEEAADVNLKKQFGDRWTRKPSSELNAQWRSDLDKMLNFLAETEKTDKLLADRFSEQENYFDLLSQGDSELLEALQTDRKSTGSSPTGSENARQEVAQVCSQIETLKADRNSLSDQLDTLKLSDDTIQKFLEMYKNNQQITEQTTLDSLNTELEGSRECVRASEKQQEELLSELQTKYEALFGSAGSTADASGLATRLTAAVDVFFALDKDVKEGMKFYAELTERCLKVQEKIDDFCLARTTEKTEHLADITSNLGRVNISDGPSAPPVVSLPAPAPTRPPPTYNSSTIAQPHPAPGQVPPQHAPVTPYAGQPGPPPNAPYAAQPGAPPPGAGMPPNYAGMPGYGWAQPAYPYGTPAPAYPYYGMQAYPQQPPAGQMPFYGYYPGYTPMPPAQMGPQYPAGMPPGQRPGAPGQMPPHA